MTWRELLEQGGVEAARDRGLDEPARAVAELGALAADAAVPAATRVLALSALARIAARAGVALPDLADVVAEEAIVAAALARGMAEALTGVVSQLPDGAYERITRKLIGYRLVGAGVRGPHVSRVLLDARELDGAARAIADDFVASVLPAVRAPGASALAWGMELADQVERHGPALAEPLRACLARRPGALEAILGLLERVGDAAAPARALLGRATERN